MAAKVGEIYYDVSLDTRKLVEGQRAVQKTVSDSAASLDSLGAGLTKITRAIQLYAVAAAAVKSVNLADEFRMLAVRVQVAAGSIDQGTEAFKALQVISTKTQTSMAANVDVFARLNQSILQMGGSQQDTLAMTLTLAQAIKVSGASAEEAKNAMLQFGQALGSGKLQGDELRSLMESAPYLMRQMADAIGVPVGALKNLGAEGKLTADVVANALSKAAERIDSDFKKFPQTFSGAMTVLEDAAARANEKLDNLTGTSAAATGIAQGLGQVFDKLAVQLGAMDEEAGKFNRNEAVKVWAEKAKFALSYLIDAADVTWQALSVLGRNVKFVFESIGTEIGGIGAQVASVLRGDFSGARAIGEAMTADAEERRRKLDEADQKTLADRKLFGQQMREAWEQAAGGGRGFINPEMPKGPSKLKAPADDDAARKLKARAEAAQAYYEGLVAENAFALDKIDAQERKALAENARRMAEDKNNASVYQAARTEIHKKFARERALEEEKITQQAADLSIQLTTDAEARIEAIRSEAFRRAEAEERLGVKTHQEAEIAKTLATAEAARARAELQERLTQTVAETTIAAATDEITRIDLIRQESFRRADAAAKAGAITYAQAEADKARAAVDAQNAIRQQVMSVNPLAQLEQEYQQKLAIVQYYEQQMAKAGVDGTQFVEQKRTELATQYQQQRLALAEAEFTSQGDGNKFVMDTLNSLSSTATSTITGLISGTMSAADAMRALGGVILNEAVKALVQIGVQYVKNALIGQAAEKAQMAAKAANAALYTASVTAQVSGTTALAAQNAFMATAAIPIIGPGLAPAAAAAAGAAAAAIGAPAIATAPVAGARQYGGGVNAGDLYRVNETGRPEMYTASNGKQYMLPTKDGNVTPADQVGGASGGWNIIINNAPVGTTANVDMQSRIIEIAVAQAKSEIAAEFSSNSGATWSALRGASNVQGRL